MELLNDVKLSHRLPKMEFVDDSWFNEECECVVIQMDGIYFIFSYLD